MAFGKWQLSTHSDIDLIFYFSTMNHSTNHEPDHKDPDGDSAMTSSVDSVRDDRAGARTPTGSAHTSAFNTSEISPPGSQSQAPAGSTAEHRMTLENQAGQSDPSAHPLVGAWKTKRAQEDYQRAMEFVIDKGFSLGILLYLGIHSMHLSLMLTEVLSYS